MIKIEKGHEPKVLEDNKTNWTDELLSYISAGTKVPDNVYNRYNNDEVKAQLKLECRNKCMYCESVVSHVSYEHIEHFMPKSKSKFPDLTYDWTNLGLACQICNMSKGDEFDTDLPFVNPYRDNPDDFLLALGHFIYNKKANRRGELTTRVLKLNRPELVEQRLERLNSINRLIDHYHSEKNVILKMAIKEEIDIEISHDKPYSMCAKSLYDALI